MDLFSDKPIVDKKQDILGRIAPASRIAEKIVSYSQKDSLVFSINGEWGSGKTSFVNLVRQFIEEKTSSVNSYPYLTKMIDFAPWGVLSQEGIIEQFFAVVSNAFSDQSLLQRIESYSLDRLAALGVPVPENSGKTASQIANSYFQSVEKSFREYQGAFDSSNRVSLAEEKQNLEHIVASLKIHFVIFIDDLDRLNKEEIKRVVQLVKSIGDLPNFIYVLSFDEKVVAAALNDEQGGGGKSYLEKIIQIRFELPPVDSKQVVGYLAEEINQRFSSYIQKEDGPRFSQALGCGLFAEITGLRKAVRFLNVVGLSIEDYSKQINIIDLLSIEYLAMYFDGILAHLDAYSSYLFGGSFDRDVSQQRMAFAKMLETRYPNDNPKNLIEFLFPHAFSYCGHKERSQALAAKLICTHEQFDFYRMGSLSHDQIAREDFFSMMKGTDVLTIERFASGVREEQMPSFFNYCECLVEESSALSDVEALVRFVLNGFAKMPWFRTLLDYRNDSFSSVLLHDVLLKFPKETVLSFFLTELPKGRNVSALGSFGFSVLNGQGDTSLSLRDKFTKEETDSLVKAAAAGCLASIQGEAIPEKVDDGIWLAALSYSEETKKALQEADDLRLLKLLTKTERFGWVENQYNHQNTYYYSLPSIKTVFPLLRTEEAAKAYLKSNPLTKQNALFERDLIAFLFGEKESENGNEATLSRLIEKAEAAGFLNGDKNLLMDTDGERQ